MPTTINITNHLEDTFAGLLGSDNTPIGALIRSGGRELTKTITLSANNTSDSVNVFILTGTIQGIQLHGSITAVTTLNNLTNAYFDLWDGTNSVPLTKTTGTTMSGGAVDSFFVKNGDALVNLAFANNSQCRLTEPATGNRAFFPFVITAKTGATTYIRFNYSTTDAPINAQIKVHLVYSDIETGTLTTA